MDDAHDAKFAEMQKYIPFLESMEKRLENCGDEVKTKAAQLTKIKSLKGLLLSKKKKMKYDNLLKCEQVLIKLYSKVEKNDFQSTKSADFEDKLDTTRLCTQTGGNSNVYSDTTFDAASFDADELNRCREKLKSITKPIDADGQDPLTMSTNKTPPSVFGDDKSETTRPKRMTNLYYDQISENDGKNATGVEQKDRCYASYFKSSTGFESTNTFLKFENSTSINYRRRSRSIEPIPSKTAMQSSINEPVVKPRIYTRVLKSPERRRSKSQSKSPPKSTQNEKQIPFTRNEFIHLSPQNDRLNLLHPIPNTSPRSEVKLASPQGAGFYTRRSPMTESSRERRSKSTSKKEMYALQNKKYQEDSISPQTSMYGSTQIDKPSLTSPVGAGFYRRRSPKRLSRGQRSRSASKKDTYNDKYVSPRTEKNHNSPRVTSPYFSGYYKHRSPKKLLDEQSSLNFNKVRKEKSMSKGFEYEKRKNKKKPEMIPEADACETEREMELLRRIRSQIVSELNATNADMDISKLISKKLLRKEKKKKSKAKVDVEEGEICDQYDELYCDLIRPERVADASERAVLLGDKVSKQKTTKLNTSEGDITSAESTQANVCRGFDELDLFPAKSNDKHTQKDDEIQKHNTAYRDINKSLKTPATPHIVSEDAIKADELDDFFCTKLVEIRKKLEENKEAKQKSKNDIKINFLSEKENKKTEIKQLDITKENEKNAFDNREPSLLDIIMNKSQSLETTRKSAIKYVDEKTQVVDKPATVQSASCGVSQSDILIALNSEIMMEKINLPDVAAQSISTKSIKKDMSDSTPIPLTAECEKKRRISLETYKEKIAPFVVPSIKDESDNSISSQNEYEDHVNLISRALTAKEYERFQSILNSTINDNISDPEAKLSLRPPNQKLTNDAVSKDQVIEDLFDTSKLLPEDLGPQSPDEELVFCDDDESPTPIVIPPDAVSSQSGEFVAVPPPNDRMGRANDVDMRISSVLPVSGTFTTSFVKPGPESDVDLFHQQFMSPQNNECTVLRTGDNAQPVFTFNKDPRKKAKVNTNTTPPYRGGNNVPGRNNTGQALYNSNLPQHWDRNLYTDSVPASPNINTFDQTQEINHFRMNNASRNRNDHNPSNFISKMPIHDQGFLSNFPNKEMRLQSNASPFGDHARELNPESSTCWRRGDNPEVHGDRFTPSRGRFAGQRESYGITNYSDHVDRHSPIADNVLYNHNNTRTKYSSDWNHSGDGQFGMSNTSGHGIRDRSNISHYTDTERFGKKYTPGGVISTMDTVADNMRHNNAPESCIGRNLGQFGYEYSQGGVFDRGLGVGRFGNSGVHNSADRWPTVGRECTPGRDFIRGLSVGPPLNREPSVGRSLNREPSAGRSLHREPSLGRVFDREASVGRTFNREPSVGRVFYREPSIGPTINREASVGRAFIREQSIGRTFNQEIDVRRTFHREPSVGRTFHRAQSVGRALTRELSVERTSTRERSVGGNFNREQSIGRSFNREPSLGRLTREPSVGRTSTRETSVGRNFIREQNNGQSLNREPSVGRTFTRDPSVGRISTREPSVGRSFNRESSIGRVFNREPSVGRVFDREPSVGRSLKTESSTGRVIDQDPSLGRSSNLDPSSRQPFKSFGRSVNREPNETNREPSDGRSLKRETSIGRTLHREPSVGPPSDKSSSFSQMNNTDNSRDRNSERSFERGRSTSRNESNDTRRRDRRSPAGRDKTQFDNSRDSRSRRELYDQQKASFPKDKYSRDPRLARERGRETEKDKSRGRHTDFKAAYRQSKSPKGFVYTKDNLAKGFSGQSGISNYKIPKIKRETIPVSDSTDLLIDENKSAITLKEVVDKPASTLDLIQDLDIRVLSSRCPIKKLISEGNIGDSKSHTTKDPFPVDLKECVNEPIVDTPEPDNIKMFESEAFVENISEPSKTVDSNVTYFESLPEAALKSSTCSELGHTGEIIKVCDQSLLDIDDGPLGKNIANDQVHSLTKGTETIIINDLNQKHAEEKHSIETLQEKQNDVKTDSLPEKMQRESENKKQMIKSLPETSSEITKENSDLETLPNPKKHNMNVAQTNTFTGKGLEESEINCRVDKISETTNSVTAEAESTNHVKLSEDTSNALPDSTIQFSNETDKVEASSGQIPDSTNNEGFETKSSEEHVTLETSIHQTGSKPQDTTAKRENDSCTPIDALGSILSILTDKSKIKEILSLLGENSATSAKIKRKLAKLTEIESDDDEEETSDPITNLLPQHSKLVHTKSTHQIPVSGTSPPKHQDPVLDTKPQHHQDLISDTLPLKPEECALGMKIKHVDLDLKHVDSEPKLEQSLDIEAEQILKSVKLVTTEKVTDGENNEKNSVTNRTKGKIAKTKSRGPKKNLPKNVIVKKRITRQSVAIKGNNVLKSQSIKKNSFVGKVSKTAKPKKKRLDELQKLQEDIREMFISDEVLSATGIRNCRITKLTDTIDTAAIKKDTVPSTSPLPLQEPTKPNKKLKKNLPKNNEQCNTSDKKVENKRTPFVVIKGLNPDVYKKAKKANFLSVETSSTIDKSLDKKTKTKKKPGPKPKTKPITSMNNTTLKQKEKADDNPEGAGSEIFILSSSCTTTTNSSEKPVVLRPGPKSKKLLCLQNMLQQNQYTIAVDEIQDIILGLRDNSNQTTQKYPEQPCSTDSEDEALSTLASRRTQDNDIIPSVDMPEDPTQITHQPEQPASDIKSVDENYCFDSLNSVYDCKLCKYNGDKIVHHYKDCHPHDEILISRIRPALVKDAIQQSRILDHENVSASKTDNTFTRFQCRFCLENFCNINLETFFWHVVTAHTGEYNYDCLLCTDDTVKEGECKQASLDIPQPPAHSAKYLIGYVCGLCSFTQISEKNVKDHITEYHNRSGIEIHVINLCNVSTTPEEGPKTSELLPATNLQKKNKLRWKQRASSSASKDDEGLSVDDVSSLASYGSQQDLAKQNALKAPTTMMDVGDLSSPTVSVHDGVTIETELQKKSFWGRNAKKNNIIPRTGTSQKIQPTTSTTAVAEKSDGDMIIKIGSIGIRKLPGGVIEYCCNVSKCLFRSTLLITFSSHLLNEHATNEWNGDCAVCKHNVKGVDGRYLHTEELNHLVHAHMDDIEPQSLETRINDIEPLTPTCVDVPAKLKDNDSSENNLLEKHTTTPRKYINVRPFSDLADNRANIFDTEISIIRRKSSSKEYTNSDSDCEAGVILQREECETDKETHVEVEAENYLHSIPQIQEVVSLNSAESGSVGRSSPLAIIASSWLEEDKSSEDKSSEDKCSEDKSSEDKSSEDSTVREIGDNIVPSTFPTKNSAIPTTEQSAEVPSEIICSSLETSTYSEKEGENSATKVTTWKPPPNTDAAAHPVFAAKSPKVVKKMMVAKKQVHPFKCGGRFCSFTTHDTSAFSAHLSAHGGTAPGVRCCVYCSFEAPDEVRALMQHVFSEHAHCQFACVYCPYVSTSSILVEMHRTRAHPEKAPAVLRLHAAHANVLTASSRGALSRPEAVLPYICKQRASCKFQCLTSAQFVSHLAEHKQTQFKCSKCPSSFARTSHLIRHLRQHGLCLYQCTFCVFGADAELDMLKHIAKEHPMRRAQAYLRHVSSNSIESDRVGLPLVNMEKKFNGKIQICESKYTEDPIAEAEAADKLQFEYETKMATEFLTNQSKEKENSMNIEMDCIQPAEEILTEMPRISFVTSIANINLSGSITSVSQPPQTVEMTTETSKITVELQEHTSAQQVQSPSNTRPKKVENIKKTPTLKINDFSKSSSNVGNESIICLDSDGEDNSEINITNLDTIALHTDALDTPLEGVEQNIKPQGLEQKIIEKSEPVQNSKPSIITLSDDEAHTPVPTSDILLSSAWTSNVLEDHSNLPSAIIEVSTKNKMVVDSTSLFRCSKCNMSTRAAYNFSMHVAKCYSKTKTSITCYHCQAIVADAHELIVHLIEHHSDSKLYKCGACQYIEWTEARFLNHMKSAHSAYSEIPIDSDSQIIVIDPKKRRKPGPKPGTKIQLKKPKSKAKDTKLSKVAISDMSDLPRTPIVNYSMYCVECGFDTKVTSNMARHLQYHESQLPVASSEPVNPVPHLESNEMHFDKMTNLAASSNMGRATEKSLLKEKPRPVSVRSHNLNPSNYPQYVLDHERYACGAIGCTYLSLNEDMLKCHWEILHAQDTNFKCPHCPSDQQLNNDKPLTSTRIAAHLKMHDSRMYVCSCCPYYHYHKHYVERHLADKHLPADNASLQCLREPPGLASSTDEAGKGTPTMDLKPWCCGFCSFKTMLRADIIEHCNKVHNIRSQYKCGSCSFNHANEQNIRKHQSLFHTGSVALKLITVYFKANRPSTEEMDGSPLWWKQRKRGPMDEPNSSPKKIKLSESNAFKSTASGSIQDANNAVNLDLVKEEPPDQMDTIQVCDKSLTCANAGQDPEIAASTFVCPLCTTYKISDVEAMKSHLYEELNYRKWGCNVCLYKSFERDRLVKHITAEHGVVQEPKSLPEDQRIEQWISTVISTQENCTKTSEKNKTIVYLMRILPGKDNTDNQTQNVTDISSPNQSTSDRKSKTKEGRKNKSLENSVKISSADAQALINTTLFRFPKDTLPKNPVTKTRTEQRIQSTEPQKVDENQQKTSETTQRIIPAKSSSQELVAIFGSFGESKGYRFVCPKCHYGVDNQDSMRKHLDSELNMHLYECDLCHLKFNSVTMYVKHYVERHNGGKGQNKVSTPRILAQAQEWMDLLITTQGQSIAGYISTHGPDPAPDCQPANSSSTQSRKRRHSLTTGSESEGDDSSDEERLVIIEPTKPQVEQSRTDNVSSNQDLTSTTDVSSDDQTSSKHLKIDSQSKAKNHKCPHCYFVTRYSTCLVDHISRHFYDRPFKCGYCEFKNYRKQVKEHIKKVHPKEVPKVIKVQFPDTPLVVDLEQQKNSGQNIIKVCLICEASLLPQQVTSHYNIMHPEAKKVLVAKGDTVYRCNDCALMLQTLDDTTEHFRSAHPRCRLNYMLHRIGGGEPQSYLCNHCSNVFPHMKDLHCHHERTHTDLEIDFADLGPSKSTRKSELECTSSTETAEPRDVTMFDQPLCGSADTTKKVIRCVARKSTAKLPPSVRTNAVARKSTTKLPFNIEQLTPFSVYGRTPDENIGHLTTKMPFYGTLMPFTVEKLKDIINISPVVLVEDIGVKSK